MKLRNLFLIASVALLLVSCGSGKEVPYMTNVDQIPAAALATATGQAGDFTIKPGDMLAINVASSSSEAVAPFNKIQYMPRTSGEGGGSGLAYNIGDNSTVFYLVDDNGNIDFPVLGKLHIGGMTKNALQDYVANLIYPRYLTERPGVECRIQNFRVFCIGEFTKPGVIEATNGRLNLIEAIALSGDLTLQGRRDNIMLIRTDATGQRTVKRINLQDANFMTMPEFELQQNDILYVQPSDVKARSAWSVAPQLTFGFSLLGTLMSVVTFVTVLANK